MAKLSASPPQPVNASPPPAEPVVSAAEFMGRYAHDHYEWVKGKLIKTAPVQARHAAETIYLCDLFRAYFALKRIGKVVAEPFVMRVDAVESCREPDLQIILNTNPGHLAGMAMIGPADIVIEVISPESVARDYGEKYQEYEQAKVKEYWIVDPIREESRFSRLNKKGIYTTVPPDADGCYATPLLPGFRLRVIALWQDPLPDVVEIVDLMKKTLKAAKPKRR